MNKSLQPPDNSVGIALLQLLSNDRSFKGIGTKKAKKLHQLFGGGLRLALLESHPKVVELLGCENAFLVQQAMHDHENAIELCQLFDELNISALLSAAEVTRIVRAWGKEGIAAIKDNPFNLLGVLHWNKVREVAKTLGITENDTRYILAAVDLELMQILHQNDTWILRTELKRNVEKRLCQKIGDEILEASVLSGGAVRLGFGIQPRGAARMEAQCALWLQELACERPRENLLLKQPSAEELEDAINDYVSGQPFALTEPQRGAIRAAHAHRAFLLCGYAGSGKTTVLRGICDTAEHFGRHPKIMTLSGRAAKRAAESTGREAITIARFVKEHCEDKERLAEETVVIVDEASMLALPDLWRILSRLGDASIILCGDPAQLPPVSFGLIFHVLADTPKVPCVTLDRVMRQREDSGIPAIAEGIRNGELADLLPFKGQSPGVSFIPCSQDDAIAQITKVGLELKRSGTHRDDMQIIGAIRSGAAGINAINSFYHDIQCRNGKRSWPSFHHICEDEPFIFTQNDNERGLTNGSMGRINRIFSEITATVDGEEMVLETQDGLLTELAYAITIHKAQGSQWRRVIVPVFPNRLMDRSLIYTALTRAQEQVVFVGDLNALKLAVSKPQSSAMRKVGFRAWLDLSFNPDTESTSSI